MGLYFLHEHPAGATSWEERCVKRLLVDQEFRELIATCVYGMGQEDEDGVALRNPPGF